MNIFKAIIKEIKDVPSDNGGPAQRRIVLYPLDDCEVTGTLEAIPPSFIPFHPTGSSVMSMPHVGAQCIAYYDIKQNKGEPRAQILSYTVPNSQSPSGEYFPDAVPDAGFGFKIGGIDPVSFIMGRNGQLTINSNNFASIDHNGKAQSLRTSYKKQSHYFAGGYCIDDFQKSSSALVSKLTPHSELYTKTQEAKKITDREMPTEKSNIIPGESYVDKVFIKSGAIFNDFGVGPMSLATHLHQIETRQAAFSDQKDTVTVLRLGYQDKGLKYNEITPYCAGNLYEWTAKTSNTAISTYLVRYGALNGDLEGADGEIYRKQLNFGLLETVSSPTSDILASGKGYEYNFDRLDAKQGFLESFGMLTTSKSLYRQHFHAYTAQNTGNYYNLEFLGVNNGSSAIFTKEYGVKTSGKANLSVSESFSSQKYEISAKTTSTGLKLAIKLENGAKIAEITLSEQGIAIDPGSSPDTTIYLGSDIKEGQQLVTKAWVEQIFWNHLHGTPAGPSTPVIKIPVVDPVAVSKLNFYTFKTKAE